MEDTLGVSRPHQQRLFSASDVSGHVVETTLVAGRPH